MVQIGGSVSQKRQQIFDFFIFFHENVFVFDIVSIFVEIFLSSYKHLHFLIYSIATKLGRQVDGVDIYKLEQKIHNGAHIVLTSALFRFCKETPWYTLTQFLTSSI